MAKLMSDAIEQFIEIFWVVFLISVVLAGLLLLFGSHIGFAFMGWVSLIFVLAVAFFFIAAFAVNLVFAAAMSFYIRFKESKLRRGGVDMKDQHGSEAGEQTVNPSPYQDSL